ncbi:MAG: TRAM domain-containing protein, partial [Planctomycetota bacterium]
YLILMVTVSLLPFVGELTNDADANLRVFDYIGTFLIVFVFGLAIILVDAATPNKRLSAVFGVYLGIGAGLVAAFAIGALLDLIWDSWNLIDDEKQAYLKLAKLAIGITLCYVAVSIVITTKDDFRLVIPYVEFAKQVRGVRPLVVDTSVLIDGRLQGLSQTGFVDAPLVLPQFVIDELQTLADSSDRLKRARGRRGLALVTSLQNNPRVSLSIDDSDVEGPNVDQKLVQLAVEQDFRLLTTDYNLNRVAQIRNVAVLNVNDLSNVLKMEAVPGEALTVEIMRRGENDDQGVGFMPDGTMVVIEHGADRIGDTVDITVSNVLQTSAGKMIFGTLGDDERPATSTDADPADGDDASTIARSATSQPRQTERPPRTGTPRSRRNPRR